MLDIKLIERMYNQYKDTGLLEAFEELHYTFGKYNPIYNIGKVAIVTEWREGLVFKKMLRSQPELHDWPYRVIESNWISILQAILACKNQKLQEKTS